MATNLKKFTITDSDSITHDVQVQSAIEDSAGNKISDTYTKTEDLKETQLGYTTRKGMIVTFHPEASVNPIESKNISFNKVAWTGSYSDLIDAPHLYEYTLKLCGGAVNGANARAWDFVVKCVSSENIDIESGVEQQEKVVSFDDEQEAWDYLFNTLGIGNQPAFFVCYSGITAGTQWAEWTGVARLTSNIVRRGSATEGTSGYGLYVDLCLMQGKSSGSAYVMIYPSLSEGIDNYWTLKYDAEVNLYKLKFEVLNKRVLF